MKSRSEPTSSFSLPATRNQVKLTAAGLAMVVQVRVTELPSCTGPEGSTETEVFLGGSGKERDGVYSLGMLTGPHSRNVTDQMGL